MNLDELMAVWKSQDTAPLHDVNRTLLQQALRQDETKALKERRRDRWILYPASAFVIGLLAFFLLLMIHARQRYVMTGWDYLVAIGGATAAVLAGAAIYAAQRAQARREQRFGESLRDQISRRIAQLDDEAQGARRRDLLILVLTTAICPLAIACLLARINDKPLVDSGKLPVVFLVLFYWFVVRAVRRAGQRASARKQDLETLLNELDDQ